MSSVYGVRVNFISLVNGSRFNESEWSLYLIINTHNDKTGWKSTAKRTKYSWM